MPDPDFDVSVRLENVKDVGKIARALEVLRHLAATCGNEQAIEIAEDAVESLQNLTVDPQ